MKYIRCDYFFGNDERFAKSRVLIAGIVISLLLIPVISVGLSISSSRQIWATVQLSFTLWGLSNTIERYALLTFPTEIGFHHQS